MKLSSSTLCGCCSRCYCHCWLMMLLIVSSVVHVSPEMPTKSTTKKYTKLYNNNYAYQNKISEFIQLNRKIPNRASKTVATISTSSTVSAMLPSLLLSPSLLTQPTTTATNKNYHYKQTNMNSLRTTEPDAITTIATRQTQSSINTTKISPTAMILPTTTGKTTITTPAPEQIQIAKQQHQNLYDKAINATRATAKRYRRIKRHDEEKQKDVFYTVDNNIEIEEDKVTRSLRTTTNYVATTSDVSAPSTMLSIEPTIETFVQVLTIPNTIQSVKDYSSRKNNNRKTNVQNKKYWDEVSIDLQQHNARTSKSSSYNSSINSNNRQKTTHILSLNHNSNNSINGTVNSSGSINAIKTTTRNSLETKVENDLVRETKTTTTTYFGQLSAKADFSKNSIHNFKNHISQSNHIESRTAVASNLSSKEINTDDSYHPQIPLSTTATTALRIPVTYSPLHVNHNHYNQLRRPALLQRYARQAATDDEQNDKCRMFIEGDPEKNELYSPDYPNDYPKNINCTRVITAPKGQIIRLDFRNSFHIEEKEECKFDFLEIRDGQYGFSNLIGKYCGTDFPPEITSKERYLWMHFHSDESIEYSGFTAVYEFIDRNRDAPSTDLNCTIERDGFEGFVNATDVPTEIKDTVIRNKIPLDCMWRIQVQEKWKIQVKFVDFKLAKPNDCETNFLDIFPEQTVMPLRVKNFCGSAGEGITSESNILHVRFYAEQSAINSTFSILYTAFRERGSSSCAEDEYDCEDATCIAGNLKCNGRNNCKFLWDEEGCDVGENGQSEHMIIIITVFGLILGGMVITFLVNCVRKIMHDQKIIREHVRQSKESKLDEMGRNSKARSRDNLSIVSPRQKHSQTSLQILDDVSNRYYREMELQTKAKFKEKDPSILRHDMIVQTSLCGTDDSSTTITEQQHQQKQAPPAGVGSNACDMGCQTRESLFATASLMRQTSKTPSIAGSQRTIEGVPPPPRFSTFGYDAAQIAPPPPPPTVSTLSRRNMHLPQESLEMEKLPQQTTHTMMMMPPHQQHQQQQLQHQHLHHRPSQEICHHHHQHQQHLQQQQKQTLPRHHVQQQQQQPQQHLQHLQQQQQQHHHHNTNATTIPPNVTQLPAPGTAIVTAISTGSSGRQREQGGGGGNIGPAGKNKQNKLDESKVFIDIRNSAPDVIIMTSH